jgi:hypothetical protein
MCEDLVSKLDYPASDADYGTYLFLLDNIEFFSRKNIKKYIDVFSNFEKNNHRLIYPDLVELIKYSLNSKKGFSFVRMGDGEGNVLGVKSDSFKSLLTQHSIDICKLQFGVGKLSLADQGLIAEYLLLSIRTSDVLGIMTPNSIIKKFELQSLPLSRQLTGNVINYLTVSELFIDDQHILKYIDSSINYDPYWENVIKELALTHKKIGIISPHNEVDDFFKSEGLDDVLFFQIPGEHKYFPHNESHFHDCFPLISAEISDTDLSGRLFLVGAGLLGKYYCHLIKKSNGVALDIGSTMDRFAGKGFTRRG